MQAIEKIKIAPGILAAVYPDWPAANPWKDSDGNPPLLTYRAERFGGLTAYGEEVTAEDLINLIPISFFRLRKNHDEILAAIDASREDFENARLLFDGTTAERSRDAIRELYALGYAGNLQKNCYGSGDAYFDGMEALAALANVPTFRRTARGSCQGDWADVLAFALPGDKDTRFNGAAPVESLTASVELWEAWAFGDVYGYILEDENGEELSSSDGHGGSCWGFYGSDHDKSGLLEAAREDAETYATAEAKERAEREALAGFVETV